MYEPAEEGCILWHGQTRFRLSWKRWVLGDRESARLTIESKPRGIYKGQVTLKKVQHLHETPLRFSHEIDLHSEGKDVIPNK